MQWMASDRYALWVSCLCFSVFVYEQTNTLPSWVGLVVCFFVSVTKMLEHTILCESPSHAMLTTSLNGTSRLISRAGGLHRSRVATRTQQNSCVPRRPRMEGAEGIKLLLHAAKNLLSRSEGVFGMICYLCFPHFCISVYRYLGICFVWALIFLFGSFAVGPCPYVGKGLCAWPSAGA